jgi:hypothetical protein
LNDKGKPYQYIAIRSDITEQFEEDFSTLANNISQLAWMADADGMVFGIISAGLITPAPLQI